MKQFLIFATIFALAQAQFGFPRQKLRFRVSARGLPDKDNIGVTDPYVELYYTENGGMWEHKFGQSDVIIDNVNPNWGNIFEFNYDPAKRQKWYFKIRDSDDFRGDDGVGKVWVVVDDYVDRGQRLTVPLSKRGYLTIETVENVQPPPQFIPGQIQNSYGPPQRLRFTLSARGLPDTDYIGTIDPYVKVYYTDDMTRRHREFGRTIVIEDEENPNFREIFEFDYIRGKQQRWYFLILDDDYNRRDDNGGEAMINVDEYVAKGQNIMVPLTKGQLYIKHV